MFILVQLQICSDFKAAAVSSALSATRWKTRVYAICGFAATTIKLSNLENYGVFFKINGYNEKTLPAGSFTRIVY